MSFKKLFTGILASMCMISLAGCSHSANNANTAPTDPSAEPNEVPVVTEINDETDMFTARDVDTDYDESESALIKLSDGAIECDRAGATAKGNTVTITQAGTYIVSGSLSDGQIVVDAAKTDKLRIVLKGASVDSSSSAALYVKHADKVFVTLAENTQNSLTSSGSFVDTDGNGVDAAIFSKDDITFNGYGSLNVSASSGHGIVSKDDLVITGGSYNVAAAKHALCGKDCVKIAGGNFELKAGTDGIHSENADNAALGYTYIAGGEFSVAASSDGIDSSGYLQIADGTFDINCEGKGLKADGDITVAGGGYSVRSTDDCVHSDGDIAISGGSFACATSDDGFHANEALLIAGGEIDVTKSYEGLEGRSVTVGGGKISITASDDGINANGGNDSSGFGGPFGGDRFGQSGSSSASIVISGGVININAGGDGVDSNGSLTVGGGELYVCGPTDNGNGAIDYDGTGSITGGIVVAVGSSGMAQNFGSGSAQGSVLINYGSKSRGAVTLKDGDGNVLVTYTPEKTYNSVLVSCPSLKKGSDYTLSACGSSSSFTLSSLIYGSGSSGGMGGPSGPGGGAGGMGRH